MKKQFLSILLAGAVLASGCATTGPAAETQKQLAYRVAVSAARTALAVGLREMARRNPEMGHWARGISVFLRAMAGDGIVDLETLKPRLENYIHARVTDPFYRRLLAVRLAEALEIYGLFFSDNPELFSPSEQALFLISLAEEMALAAAVDRPPADRSASFRVFRAGTER